MSNKKNKKKVEDKKVEDKKEKEAKPIVHKIDGRRIGTNIIQAVKEVEINGKEYNHITTVDETTFILNDKDFNLQVSK